MGVSFKETPGPAEMSTSTTSPQQFIEKEATRPERERELRRIATVKLQAATRGRKARKLSITMRLAKAVMKRVRRRAPQIGAFTATPINASYTEADAAGTPEDASCYERTRDGILHFFVQHYRVFLLLAVLCFIAVVVFGLIKRPRRAWQRARRIRWTKSVWTGRLRGGSSARRICDARSIRQDVNM